ncbi:hypothetical protein Z051_03455 [Rhodococcus rhodochrous KG-21]|uniref:Uncharacterized protein n=1 Tax=Rhodococcus rhodochrous KG-21 TaxID=1441923 RepID=A0A0M8PJ13_RHORH|nr:hypothetical protein Z051_03455 [Rhodococcus rhodochrous KG-21]
MHLLWLGAGVGGLVELERCARSFQDVRDEGVADLVDVLDAAGDGLCWLVVGLRGEGGRVLAMVSWCRPPGV